MTLSNLTQTYTGSALTPTATTSPAGLGITWTGAPDTNAGSYAVTATVNNPNYQGSASGTFTINKATPTISWLTPAAITYGTALSGTQLNATANVPGTFAYNPPSGTVLAAGGNQALSTTFTPTNTTDYNNASGSVSLTVNKALLTVTANNASMLYGQALPSFSDTITGFENGDTSAVVLGTATETTTATSTSPPGNYPITFSSEALTAANYTFTYVPGTLTIAGGASQTITFSPLPNVTYGVAPITLTATASSGLTVTYSASGRRRSPARR